MCSFLRNKVRQSKLRIEDKFKTYIIWRKSATYTFGGNADEHEKNHKFQRLAGLNVWEDEMKWLNPLMKFNEQLI